ncbi:MAG: NUDIX domain-containing protein [Novosphingobium sp.]
MSDSTADPLITIPAATVVVFRRDADGGPPQILMLERSGTMRFAGGAAVFPGGRVDEADRLLAARLLPDAHAENPADAAARVAAVRETLEEAGLVIAVNEPVSAVAAVQARAHLLESGELAPVLEQFGWTLDLGRLQAFAHWCPQMHRAFDTRFYLADLGTGAVEIAVDATENSHMFWASAAQVLAMADRGELLVIFPTRRNLERLALFGSFAEAVEHCRVTPVLPISPSRITRDGELYLTIPEGLGYPVTAEPLRTAKTASFTATPAAPSDPAA